MDCRWILGVKMIRVLIQVIARVLLIIGVQMPAVQAFELLDGNAPLLQQTRGGDVVVCLVGALEDLVCLLHVFLAELLWLWLIDKHLQRCSADGVAPAAAEAALLVVAEAWTA